MPVLSQIWIYPVKSLAGIRLQKAQATATGLQYDRQWMLIDDHGRFLSQRRLPAMALIRPQLQGEQLVLSAPGQADISLPLQPGVSEDIQVSIWDDECLAQTCEAEVDRWFSLFLKTDCRLVYHPINRKRQVDLRFARPGDQTAFSDGFPFLVVSEASLNAFNQATDLNLSMVRFRPNLVISDCHAFAEDSWRKININAIQFRLPKPCSRCTVPAIDPETANTDKEVLSHLNRLRRWNGKVYFGQNALHDNTNGFLSEGDTVKIIETGESHPPVSLTPFHVT